MPRSFVENVSWDLAEPLCLESSKGDCPIGKFLEGFEFRGRSSTSTKTLIEDLGKT